MKRSIHDIIVKELECLQNRCIDGDITVIVYELLKTTEDLDGLLKALGVKTPKKKNAEQRQDISMFDQLLNAGVKFGVR